MKSKNSQELKLRLGQLFCESLKMSHSLYQLEHIRQKIEGRGYQPFDKGDIINEFGRLQSVLEAINHEMLRIYNLLDQQQ